MHHDAVPVYTQIPRSVKLKNSLLRAYSSKKIQVFYIIMIIFCVIDLASAIIYFVISKSYPIWTIALDLVLNCIILVDCILRIWVNGVSSSVQIKQVSAEIAVIVLSIPEMVLNIISMFSSNKLGYILEIVSISFTALFVFLRPFLFFKLKKKSIIQSIYLPSSFCNSTNNENLIVKKTEIHDKESNRIDSLSTYSYN